MGKFEVTPEQREQLKRSDSTPPEVLPGAGGLGKGTYHNPVTGKEIRSLNDPYHLALRMNQGWKLGPASLELREKWKIREAELRAEDDKMEAEYLASREHQDAENDRFTEAVSAAVIATLEKLNIDLPGVLTTGAEPHPPAPTPEAEPEGTQLSLFASIGATTESD